MTALERLTGTGSTSHDRASRVGPPARCSGSVAPNEESAIQHARRARLGVLAVNTEGPDMSTTVPHLTLNNGVEMPAIGLGVFQTPPDETREAVAAALDTGYRHIDTAAAYGNEREVGQAVHASKSGRAAVFLETKIWISDYGYDENLHG